MPSGFKRRLAQPGLNSKERSGSSNGKTPGQFASQLEVGKWHDSLGNPTLADAMLDRQVHHAHQLILDGESMGKPRPISTKETDPELTPSTPGVVRSEWPLCHGMGVRNQMEWVAELLWNSHLDFKRTQAITATDLGLMVEVAETEYLIYRHQI